MGSREYVGLIFSFIPFLIDINLHLGADAVASCFHLERNTRLQSILLENQSNPINALLLEQVVLGGSPLFRHFAFTCFPTNFRDGNLSRTLLLPFFDALINVRVSYEGPNSNEASNLIKEQLAPFDRRRALYVDCVPWNLGRHDMRASRLGEIIVTEI